jgi:hypothetical protein
VVTLVVCTNRSADPATERSVCVSLSSQRGGCISSVGRTATQHVGNFVVPIQETMEGKDGVAVIQHNRVAGTPAFIHKHDAEVTINLYS